MYKKYDEFNIFIPKKFFQKKIKKAIDIWQHIYNLKKL